jgi:hypothetical protein
MEMRRTWLLVALSGFVIPYIARVPGAATAGREWVCEFLLLEVPGHLFVQFLNLLVWALVPVAVVSHKDKDWAFIPSLTMQHARMLKAMPVRQRRVARGFRVPPPGRPSAVA